jgi:hypothetical protein
MSTPPINQFNVKQTSFTEPLRDVELEAKQETLAVPNSVWVPPSSGVPELNECFNRDHTLLVKAIELAKKLSEQPQVLDPYSEKVDMIFKEVKKIEKHEGAAPEFNELRKQFFIFIRDLTMLLIPENEFIVQMELNLKERGTLFQGTFETLLAAPRELIQKVEEIAKQCSNMYSEDIFMLIELANQNIKTGIQLDQIPSEETHLATQALLVTDLAKTAFVDLQDYLASIEVETISIPELKIKLENFAKYFTEIEKIYTMGLGVELNRLVETHFSQVFENLSVQ